MVREIRAPEQVTDELDAWKLVMYATDIAEIVSRYTSHTEQHVLECVMRVVGHLCSTGGTQSLYYDTQVTNRESDLTESKAENAKLHELVRDYYVFMFCDCYACRLYDECHGDGCEDRKPFCILPARLGERTRELGVEVS